MTHEIEIVGQAIDQLLLNNRAKRDAEKLEQYGGVVKTAFYASELGTGERKLVYSWFSDRIGQLTPKTPQNMRVFDNGDYVHLRYRDYMEQLGALLSEEQPIRANQFEIEGHEGEIPPDANPWRISARYDQIVDLNVLRAYVDGEETWINFLNENYLPNTIKTTVKNETTGAIIEETQKLQWVPKEGYAPDQAILDIKSQNEWGFNRVVKDDYSDIQGYFDQLTYYEHQKGINKGALVIEDKGKQRLKIVPVDYDPGRVLGDDTQEGLAKRLERVWEHVKNETVPEERCAGANRNKFPCMWSTGQCDFYAHCWNEEHNGAIIPGAEPDVELPSVEELITYLTDKEYGVSAIRLYLKDFPGGQEVVVLQGNMPQPMIENMLDYYADFVTDLDYLDDQGERIQTEDEADAEEEVTTAQEEAAVTQETTEDAPQEAVNPDLYGSDGTLNFDVVEKQATERVREDGDKEINCVACDFKIVYKKCYGGVKPCPSCGHKNSVVRA